MAKPQFQRIRGIVISLGILTAALCLMGACGYLLFSGGGFSREAVAHAFRSVSLPVYLGLGLAVLGFLLDIFQPRKRERLYASRQDWLILRRLRESTDHAGCDAGLRADILRERRGQRMRKGILLVPVTLCCAAFAWYLLSGDPFSREDINSSVLGCMGVLIPGLALCLGWSLAVVRKNAESCRREIGLLKQVAAPGKSAPKPPLARTNRILRYSLLGLAVSMLLWGFLSGGAADVLTKAINICTECIGLG